MTAPFGSTSTTPRSFKVVADEANPETLADVAKLLKLGTTLSVLKRTFTGLTAAATYNLTTLDASGETVGAANANRLPAFIIRSLRVTAATTANTVGSYAVTDVAGTVLTPTAGANVGLARISDDGTTLTFATADVTAFIVEYMPLVVSAASMAANFPL